MTTTITARTPQDLIDVVPVVLGFHPTDSLVMLTFEAERAFHARVDLPSNEEETADMVAALVAPCLRHKVGKAALIEYAEHRTGAPEAVASALNEAGIVVVAVIHTLNADRGNDQYGEALDSRSDLETQVTRGEQLSSTVVDDAEPYDAADLVASFTSGEVDQARALAALRIVERRDEVLYAAARLRDTGGLTALEAGFQPVVKVAPESDRAMVCAIFAFVAWQRGSGALAWCAVDASREAGGHHVADLMDIVLRTAVEPSSFPIGGE